LLGRSSKSTRGRWIGQTFLLPEAMVHITEKFFRTDGHMDFLNHICDVASEKGNTYFVFDRGRRLRFRNAVASALSWIRRTRRCQAALENALLCPPECHPQPAKDRLSVKRDDSQLFSKIAERMELGSRPIWKRNSLSRNCCHWVKKDHWRCSPWIGWVPVPENETGQFFSSAWLT